MAITNSDFRGEHEERPLGALPELEGPEKIDLAGDFLERKYASSLAVVRDFFERGRVPQEAAVSGVADVLGGAELDPMVEIGKADPKVFKSRTDWHEDPDGPRSFKSLPSYVNGYWLWQVEGAKRQPFVDAPFYNLPGSWLTSNLALQCPRMPKKYTAELVAVKDPAEAMRFQAMFLQAGRKALDGDKFYREAYFLAQSATFLTLNNGEEIEVPEMDRVVKSVSAKFFEGKEDPEAVEKYIVEMLSLMMPKAEGGDIVQEEYVLFDLIGLAKKNGLYEKFASIFLSIMDVRKVQFIKKFHLNPRKQDGKRMSILDVVKGFMRPPSVASLGSGDLDLEEALLAAGLISSVDGVDIKEKVSHVTTHARGRISEVLIGTKAKHDLDVKKAVLNSLPKADLVILCDSIHETSHPCDYFIEAVKRARGSVYFSDPIRSKAVDAFTEISVNRMDNTAYPESMLSVEKYLAMLLYLKMAGYEVDALDIIPGAIDAGYNDVLWRITGVLKAPEPTHDTVIGGYSIPASYDFPSRDFLNQWPFSLMSEEAKFKITGTLSKESLTSARDAVRKYISLNSSDFVGERLLPYANLDDLIEAIFGDHFGLKNRQRMVAEINDFKATLKAQGIELDLGEDWDESDF